MVAEFESDLIRLRTREGMKVAKTKGHLRGKQPKLNRRQRGPSGLADPQRRIQQRRSRRPLRRGPLDLLPPHRATAQRGTSSHHNGRRDKLNMTTRVSRTAHPWEYLSADGSLSSYDVESAALLKSACGSASPASSMREMPSRLLAVTFDAHDPARLAGFWAGVLGRGRRRPPRCAAARV